MEIAIIGLSITIKGLIDRLDEEVCHRWGANDELLLAERGNFMMNDNSKKVYFVFEYANGAVVVLCSLLCG